MEDVNIDVIGSAIKFHLGNCINLGIAKWFLL